MSLSDIVNVQISRQTTAVTRAGFGIGMFLGTHRVFNDLAREYASTTAMGQDGFVAADPEMQAATAYFAQSGLGTPTKIIIGRRAANVSTATFKVMTAIGQVQGVTINGTTFDFTSTTGSETAAAVATAVDVLVNAGSEPVTSVDLGTGGTFADGTISLTSDVAAAGDTVIVSTTSTAAVKPALAHINVNPAAIDDINAIEVVNKDWYGLIFHDHRRAFTRVTMSAAPLGTETAGVMVNSTDFEFTVAGVEDAVNVATNIVTLVNAGSEPVVAINNFDGTLDIVDTDASLLAATVVDSTNNTTANTFNVLDPVIDLATGIEAKKKLFGTSSQDGTAISVTDATDTLSNAKRVDDANYARTYYIHDAEADTAYPEAAWMGHLFPSDPGSATWKFKTLSTITSENLTETQINNLHAKNANSYVEIGGVDITCEGTVGEGEFIDVIRGVDWLDARLTERIFSRLVNLPKIPYSNPGIATIEAEIRAQLDEGIASGFLRADPASYDGEPYSITVPLVKDVSFTDRANRQLTNVNFTATLAGAIHAVTVSGVVTV